MADKRVRDLIFETVMGAVIKGVAAAVPFFRLPVVNTVFSFVVMKVANLIYVEISRYAVFSLIDLRVDKEKSAYVAAVKRLKIAKPEEVAHAEEEFKRTLSDLVRLRP